MLSDFFWAFALYGSFLATISFFVYKKSSNTTEFMLGNRTLNYWATALAAHSSDMSIWLFMGLPGTVYAQGLAIAWVPIGLVAGMFLAWTFIAPTLRRATEQHNALTLSSFFEAHFHDNSGKLRTASALICLIFFSFYISSGLVGMGTMFENVFGINYHIGILIALCTTVAYTFFGGFIGVAWCDLFQALFLAAMIIMVPCLAFDSIGSWQIVSHAALLQHIPLTFIPTNMNGLFSALILAFSWGLGYFGQPHILINFMGINNTQEIKKARFIGMTWQVLTLGAALAVGLLGIAFFSPALPDKELVFVAMVQHLFSPFFAGIVLCAIIAAGLTTVDTQILVAASTFTHDLYQHYFNPQATEKQQVLVSRITMLIIAVMSYAIAWNKSTSVYGLVAYAWSGLGSSFGPTLLASLYFSRATTKGTFYGMLAGACISSLWPLFITEIPAMIPGFLMNMLCIIIFFKEK